VTKRIITIEEPVEYELKGINQIAVRGDIGLTFAMGLRHILRQDPNVIMVGEIRDMETAEIAIRASLTGHLVFSTLHTNDAPSAFTRLIDMGIEPFLVASSVEAVLAQRLVRTICPACKSEQKVERAYLIRIGFPENEIDTTKFWKGAGCEGCRQLGYQGRMGIYELLFMDEEIRSLIMTRANSSVIAGKAMANGMRTLRNDGWKKVRAGQTTIEEVIRVTQTEEHFKALIEDTKQPAWVKGA
jgi:type II secretory ATPase GspE/PulE/Tfp pilus assembly ATPase PilB-like protein